MPKKKKPTLSYKKKGKKEEATSIEKTPPPPPPPIPASPPPPPPPPETPNEQSKPSASPKPPIQTPIQSPISTPIQQQTNTTFNTSLETPSSAKRRCKSLAQPTTATSMMVFGSGDGTPGSARKRDKARRSSIIRPTNLPEIDIDRLRRLAISPTTTTTTTTTNTTATTTTKRISPRKSTSTPKQPSPPKRERDENSAETKETPIEKKTAVGDGGAFGQLGESVRECLQEIGIPLLIHGDSLLEKCCKNALSRFQRQLFYEWTSMTTGRSSKHRLELIQAEIAETQRMEDEKRRKQRELEMRRSEILKIKGKAEKTRLTLASELRKWEEVISKYSLPIKISDNPLVVSFRIASDQPKIGEITLINPQIQSNTSSVSSVNDIHQQIQQEKEQNQRKLREFVEKIDKLMPVAETISQRIQDTERDLPRIVSLTRDLAVNSLLSEIIPSVSNSVLPSVIPIIPNPNN